MKVQRLWILSAIFIALSFVISKSQAMTINEVEIGQTASATPTSVGTSTPVPILHCPSILNAKNPLLNPVTPTNTATQHQQTLYVHICVTGGTSGTDGCYVGWAPQASPCAAASPAPNSSTDVGLFIPTGGSSWTCQDINYPSALGGQANMWLQTEMDAVCTAGSMKVSRVTLP